jgi:hypothetical protein
MKVWAYVDCGSIAAAREIAVDWAMDARWMWTLRAPAWTQGSAGGVFSGVAQAIVLSKSLPLPKYLVLRRNDGQVVS